MHDDVRDAEAVEFGEHALEFRSIDSGCRSTKFDIFADDLKAEFFGSAFAGVPLERDRVALSTATDAGLLFGADADVDDGTATLDP
ncbi:hypothetical protein WDS16_21135 [Rhodococcus sovatensis]|uniref:Uncharacterized protein n=1 Tax=Rhodococcus sovatensis TaxID=1805840 RepID=A0ABZ2PF27_9NOCA